MKWHRPIVLMAVVALLSVLVFQIQVESTSAERSYTVSIPGTAVQEAARLGLNPHVAWDYGSFHWLQISAADFARLEASDIPFTYEADAGTLQVTRYRFDPLADGEPKLSETERMNQTGQGFRLIQFDGPVNNQRLESLAATGVHILQYYPHHTYLVWGTAAQAQAATRFDFIRWQGAFHPAYKMNSDLDGRTGKVENVDIFFYNDGAIEATLGTFAALGANILQHYPAQPDRVFYIANVELDAAAFTAVAQINTVLWFGYASPEPELEDEMSSQIIAGNHPGGIPVTGYYAHLGNLGYDGSDVRWATIDTGVDYDHPDLGPRIVAGYSFPGACNPPGQPGSDCSGGGHGTHVAGIIGGDATAGFSDASGFLYGLGVAPGHDIVALNSLSASAWPPAGGWQEHSKQAVLLGAVGGNNSWTTGEGTAHGYQASERTHDTMVRDGNFDTTTVAEPFIEVFSAGNSGPGASTLTAPKEGKNLIIVASSVNYRVGNINTISSFSSRGPAVDGRLGVTVAAPGQQISSARNDLGGSCSTAIAGTNNLYAFCSGTSMAAPHVAGAIVLATEWWREFNGGANPSPAMAKALLVNSAVPMATIPNTSEGWGRINITNMLAPQANVLYYDQTHLFTETGQQWTLSVGVPDTSQPLKVTLAWSDAPGAVGANPALVNNLNLTIENSGNSYRGNVFSSSWSTTGGAYDNLNNLENVYIQNPGGSATITIDAANIAGDGVPYNGFSSDQDFALICYNCALFPDFTLTVTPASQSVCAPSNAVFDVGVGNILGFNDPVTLSVMGNPAGTTAGFSQNPVTPPGSSELTIGNIGAAAPGSYSLAITGVAPTSTHTSEVNLHIFTQAPGAPALVSPTNGALNVPQQAVFSWNAAAQGASYTIQIATDSSFNNIVESATLSETSYTAANLNTSTRYYWRVQATNSCGSGTNSSVFTFTTVAAPGDCGPGTTPNVIYEYGFEGGAAGWTTPAGTGTNTWAILTTNPYAGANHYRGAGTASVTDQRLVSPEVVLPTGQNPVVLKFQHVPNLETATTGCFDAGILEVSADGGGSWTQVPSANLLVGDYTGSISSSWGNPLGGLQGWCGPNTTTYQPVVADVSGYTGQTVQFRWRIGTDSSVSRPGWDVDNVSVQSCQAAIAAILDPASDVTVLPGETAVHEFTLSNLGLDDVYDLAISGGNWSTTLQTSSPVTLTGGSSAIITVAVETPMLVGSDSFTLTVTSQGDPGLVLTALGTTYTEVDAGLITSGDSELWGTAGITITHMIAITNSGALTDTFTLEILGGHAWTTWSDQADVGPLAPGATVQFAIHVLVGSGAADTATLRIKSGWDTTIYRDVQITTRTHLVFLPMSLKQ
jgi:subtilisin family serine protease